MRTMMLVATGGIIGATARWTINEWLGRDPASFPWATLLVNIVGCVLIGAAAGRFSRTTDAWAFAVTGVLGGLTTFSAFAVETRALLAAQRPIVAATYVAISLVAGVGAVEVARGQQR